MMTLNLNIASGQTGTGLSGVHDSSAGTAATGLDALLREPTFTFSGANQRGLANSPGLEDDGPPIIVEGRPQKETLGDTMPAYLRVSNFDMGAFLKDLDLALQDA